VIAASLNCRASELERSKAETAFEAQLAVANEHSKVVFNAAPPTRSRSPPDNKKPAPQGRRFDSA
jgi:hypothetical protein